MLLKSFSETFINCMLYYTNMVAENKIVAAIGKAQKFLLSYQHADGSWRIEEIKHKEPSVYQTPLVLTSQCMQSLMFLLNQEHIPAINKALRFCLIEEISDKDPIDLCAWKLLALRFSNAALYAKEQEKLAARLAKEQTSEGCWYTFPSTSNLTNFSCILALKDFEFQKNLEKAKAWFKQTRAEDGKGWGFNDNSKESEISFTGNVILALLLTGEDPLCAELQQARKFLEDKQFKDGGWSSSKLTIVHKPTTYSTAVAIMSLMQLSEDPFNERVEKGVKALLDAQLENGCWPLVFGEETIDYYPTLYAIKALSYYLYLK
ncbi:MAG: prenyltransferase/squalene oxidase repeat-containing protein, partial [Candidatus Nanoarchaeia archaeon]